MVVFDGKRTPLPDGGIPPFSSRQVELRIDPPASVGRYKLCLTLVRESASWFETDEGFQPHIFDAEFINKLLPASSSPQPQPVIICAYLHDADVPKVRETFGLDEERGKKLDFFFWKDVEQLGPEKAFQHCWKLFPNHDVIIIHPDMAPLPDDLTNSWYDALLDYAAKLPKAGIIGCDLLFPRSLSSGGYSVQCAGGTFENGNISHIAGRTLEYSHDLRQPREVAWATFGGVYIRRSTLEACGDLDPAYQWAYVGDVDYCFEARRRGINVYQVPVNLLHVENGTTEPFLKLEKYQIKKNKNTQRFHDKWKNSALYRRSGPSALGNKPELFLVLGMHRSGTSLLTRLLRCLDAQTTDRLVDPMPDNPKGFFEDRDIYEFHENALMPALGATWDSVRLPNWAAMDNQTGRSLHKQALHILQRNYHWDQTAWTIKDPRFMILLPFWLPLLERMFAKVNFVLALRDPKEVAASLLHRNNLTAKHAEDLFAHYWLSALSILELENCIRVDFAHLIHDPKGALNRVANHCSYRIGDAASAELEVFQREFFDPSLVHSAAEPQLQESNSLSSLLYKALSLSVDLTARGLPDEIAQALSDYQAESRLAAKLFTQLAEGLARQLPTLR